MAASMQSPRQGSLRDPRAARHAAPPAAPSSCPRRPPLAHARRVSFPSAAHSRGATARRTLAPAGKASRMRAETGRMRGAPLWPSAESFLLRTVRGGVLSNVTGWACSEFWAIYQARLTVAYPNPPHPHLSCWCRFGGPLPSQPPLSWSSLGRSSLCLPLAGRLPTGSCCQRRSKFEKRGLVSRELISYRWASNAVASDRSVSATSPPERAISARAIAEAAVLERQGFREAGSRGRVTSTAWRVGVWQAESSRQSFGRQS